MNTYSKNLETGKIELHFEKSVYLALPEDQKREIKSNFLWSNYAKGWVSRSKNNTYYAEQVAKKLNLTFEGEQGEKLSFAEQVEREQERAEARVERMENRASKAEQQSTAAYQRAKQIGDFIPFGQPILVGHHSEKRHRRDIERIDNSMRKSCELSDKAEYYNDRAEAASYTATGAKFKNVNYLLNRIAECNKNLRELNRYLAGINLVNRVTGERGTKENPLPISDRQREAWTAKVSEWTEKLDFFNTKLQEIGGGQLTAERLKEAKPKYVKCGGTWYPLKSINRDTVTVLNWIGIAHWTWKFKFDQIQSMEAGHVTIVYDRDSNEVKPTIKYK